MHGKRGPSRVVSPLEPGHAKTPPPRQAPSSCKTMSAIIRPMSITLISQGLLGSSRPGAPITLRPVRAVLP